MIYSFTAIDTSLTMCYNISVDIWIGRCNKGCKCSYCGEPIVVGEPEVFGKLWQGKKTEEGMRKRVWTLHFHWHAQRKRDGQCCWLIAGLEYLSKTPHIETRGRKKLLLPKDVRLSRLKLLQKRAKVLQQVRTELEKEPVERNVNEFIRLGGILTELKEKIAVLGGVPKGW